MKAITVYEAKDGSRWDDQERALQRDIMFDEAQLCYLKIGPRPDVDSDHFKQHRAEHVAHMRECYAKLAVKYFGTLNGRVVSDSGNPVADVLWRISCIDYQNREWQQPFYANHPVENAKAI